MRKFLIIVLLLAICALGYIGYAHFSGGAVPTFGLPIGGEKSRIRDATKTFFENVKFKNRQGLDRLVKSDASPDEISKYLSTTIGIEMDALDLEKIIIKHIDLDSHEQRARVKVALLGQNLAINKPFEIERIIFLYKFQERWLIDIDSP